MTDMIIKGPAMIPGRVDRGGDDPLTIEEIKKAENQFMADYKIIDVQHNFKKLTEPFESEIIQKQIEFNDRTYPPGTWFLTTIIKDPIIQEAILKGELTGYSPAAMPDKNYDELKRVIPEYLVAKSKQFKDYSKWFVMTVSLVDVPDMPDSVFKVMNMEDFITTKIIKKEADKLTKEENENGAMALLRDMFAHIIKKEAKVDENKYESGLEAKVTELKTENENKDKKIAKLEKRLEKLEKADEKQEDKEEDEKESKDKDKNKKEKKDDKEGDKENKDKQKDNEDKEEIVEEKDKEEQKDSVEDKVIKKSIDIDSANQNSNPSFMESIGCDSMGRNKKYL